MLSESTASKSDENLQHQSKKVILKLQKCSIKVKRSIIKIRHLNLNSKSFQKIIFKVDNHRKKVVPQSQILAPLSEHPPNYHQTQHEIHSSGSNLNPQNKIGHAAKNSPRLSFAKTTINLADEITSWNKRIAEISTQISDITKAVNSNSKVSIG